MMLNWHVSNCFFGDLLLFWWFFYRKSHGFLLKSSSPWPGAVVRAKSQRLQVLANGPCSEEVLTLITQQKAHTVAGADVVMW